MVSAEHMYIPVSLSTVCTTFSSSEREIKPEVVSDEETRLMLPPLVKTTSPLLHVSSTVVRGECVTAH